MPVGIYAALSGMKMKQEELDIVANNLANSSTNGFKENNVSFQSILSKKEAAKSEDLQTEFVGYSEKTINMNPGDVFTTNNPLDVAIQGNSFFEVQTAGGTFYTRNGSFALNNDGEIINHQGEKIVGENGPIRVEKGGHIEISLNGTVTVDGSEVGKLKLVAFQKPQALKTVGSNLFKIDGDNSIVPDSGSTILQGKLENSNVNVTLNLVKLLDINRQHQNYQKIIQTQQKIDDQISSSIGRIS